MCAEEAVRNGRVKRKERVVHSPWSGTAVIRCCLEDFPTYCIFTSEVYMGSGGVPELLFQSRASNRQG